MNAPTPQVPSRKASVRRFRLSLRGLLLGTLLVAAFLGWYTGRIAFLERPSSRIAEFGGDLAVYEWEMPDSVQAFALQVDGEIVNRLTTRRLSADVVRLAVIHSADVVTFHVQYDGVSTKWLVPRLPSKAWQQSCRGRNPGVDGRTPLLALKGLDAEWRPVQSIEFVAIAGK